MAKRKSARTPRRRSLLQWQRAQGKGISNLELPLNALEKRAIYFHPNVPQEQANKQAILNLLKRDLLEERTHKEIFNEPHQRQLDAGLVLWALRDRIVSTEEVQGMIKKYYPNSTLAKEIIEFYEKKFKKENQ